MRIRLQCAWFGLLTAGLLILVAATPAQAVTAWHLRPVQRDPLLWVGSSQIGGAPDVALTVPSATGVNSQSWVLRRVGGTPAQPWFRVFLYPAGRCMTLEDPNSTDVRVLPCQTTGVRTDWWQFRATNNQPLSPYLYPTLAAWRLVSFYRDKCLSVPLGQFVAGARLRTEPCGNGLHQRWTTQRFTLP